MTKKTFNANTIASIANQNLQRKMDEVFTHIQNSIVDYVESTRVLTVEAL